MGEGGAGGAGLCLVVRGLPCLTATAVSCAARRGGFARYNVGVFIAVIAGETLGFVLFSSGIVYGGEEAVLTEKHEEGECC